MAYITFNDGTAAQLDNGLRSVASGVGSRFSGWTPGVAAIGPTRHALGTGQRYQFTFRTDYTARFALREIPGSNLSIALRLIAWLNAGGTCAVYCEDTGSHSYTTCGVAEGGTAMLAREDTPDQTWRVELALVNLAGSPSVMLCTYD